MRKKGAPASLDPVDHMVMREGLGIIYTAETVKGKETKYGYRSRREK